MEAELRDILQETLKEPAAAAALSRRIIFPKIL
jgi:hypothetical protein